VLLIIFTANCINAKESIVLTTHNLAHYGEFPQGAPIKPIADDTFRGEAIDTVRCAIGPLPYELQVKVMPWKRAQHTVKIGHADGFFAASQNSERDRYAVLYEPIASQKWTWFYKKNALLPPTHPAFKSKATVGSFNGANMRKWLIENNYNVGVNVLTSEALVKSLYAGRIDAILANDRVMAKLIQNHDDIIVSEVHSNRPLSVYFSKSFVSDNPTFLAQFNNRVKECRKSY